MKNRRKEFTNQVAQHHNSIQGSLGPNLRKIVNNIIHCLLLKLRKSWLKKVCNK